MLNSATITIVGNATEDPSLGFSKTGDAVASFGVAVNERVRDGDEWRDGTPTYYNVSVWKRDGEAVAEHVRKGQRLIVVGRLKQSTYTGRNGDARVSLEVTADVVGIVPRPAKMPVETASAEAEAWEQSPEPIPF